MRELGGTLGASGFRLLGPDGRAFATTAMSSSEPLVVAKVDTRLVELTFGARDGLEWLQAEPSQLSARPLCLGRFLSFHFGLSYVALQCALFSAGAGPGDRVVTDPVVRPCL